MATWEDVRAHVRSRWVVQEVEGVMAIEFATGGGRTQMTAIRYMAGGTEPRIRLESQFGWAGDLDPAAALRINGALPVGAISVDEDDRLLLAHSFMLGTLDLESIDIALRTIAVYADKLERQHRRDDLY